jgi:hypothetical protein
MNPVVSPTSIAFEGTIAGVDRSEWCVSERITVLQARVITRKSMRFETPTKQRRLSNHRPA